MLFSFFLFFFCFSKLDMFFKICYLVLPDSIGDCFKLESLYLGRNKLTGMTSSIGNLAATLRAIDISYNLMDGETLMTIESIKAYTTDNIDKYYTTIMTTMTTTTH